MNSTADDTTTDDTMDAIVTALERLGEDGHGKDGLEGRMFTMARFSPKRFGIFLERALRLRMNAKPDPTAGSMWHIYDKMVAKLREREEPKEGVRARGTRDLTEAVINAAIRHGSDGHGANGLVGYVVQLERTEPKISDRLIGLAQLWQAEVAARPKQPEHREDPTLEEINAIMGALGIDYEAIDKELDARRGWSSDVDE